MRIAIISTAGAGGGAPRAMRRLALGLEARGHAATVIQLAGQARGGLGSMLVEADPSGRDADAAASADFIDFEYVPKHFAGPNTFFSLESRGLDLTQIPGIERFDVFNIHWTSYLLNPESIVPLAELGRPLVFTLHDMGHFTGGCHYAVGCDGFERHCDPCWQMPDDHLGMTRALLASRRHAFRRDTIAAVSPSAWLADAATRSGVFEPGGVHWISNGVETDIFRPRDKAAARRRLGLDPGRRSILFGAQYNNETRKGLSVLLEALQRLRSELQTMDGATTGNLDLLVFGEATPEVSALGVPVTAFGVVSDDDRLASIYNAADFVVLPSLEDNQPNIMLEAMACGVPVLGSAVGGIVDVIRDGANGRLVPPGDPDALAAAMRELVINPDATRRLGQTARFDIIERATLSAQASRYEALFKLLRRKAAHVAAGGAAVLAGDSAKTSSDPVRLPERVATRVASAAVLAERARIRGAQQESAAGALPTAPKDEQDEVDAPDLFSAELSRGVAEASSLRPETRLT